MRRALLAFLTLAMLVGALAAQASPKLPTGLPRAVAAASIRSVEAPRACNDLAWGFFDSGIEYRLSFCANDYFVQDVVKAHAKLHLYQRTSPTASWTTPASVDSITVNAWTLYKTTGPNATTVYERAPASRGAGPAEADFYSAGVGMACPSGGYPYAWVRIYDESVRLANGHAYLGPGGASEQITSNAYARPC